MQQLIMSNKTNLKRYIIYLFFVICILKLVGFNKLQEEVVELNIVSYLLCTLHFFLLYITRTSAPLVKVNSSYMKHKV